MGGDVKAPPATTTLIPPHSVHTDPFEFRDSFKKCAGTPLSERSGIPGPGIPFVQYRHM